MTREALKLALEALEFFKGLALSIEELERAEEAITAIKAALAAPVQELVAWMPITEPYPPGDELDILMGDGSILCAVLPQADGDLWWGGSGTGEKFIDPQYTNVTHWRIHSDTTPPAAPVQEPDHIPDATKMVAAQRPWVGLTQQEVQEIHDTYHKRMGPQEFAAMLEQRFKEKNTWAPKH